MTAPITPANPYDGKPFFIINPDPTRPGLGFVAPTDGSGVARPIMGCEHGGRYALGDGGTLGDSTFGKWLSGDGKIESAVDGPWVGKEIDEYLSKKGMQATPNFPDVSPFPGWTVAQYEAPLLDAVVGGPNAGPDKAPEYKQVGGEILPIGATPSPNAPPAANDPAAPATGAPSSNAPLPSGSIPSATVPVAAPPETHESWLANLEVHAETLGRAAEADAKALLAKLRNVFAAAKAKL
jgi:hypothetical protein